jgi:exosortase/archaeosortase
MSINPPQPCHSPSYSYQWPGTKSSLITHKTLGKLVFTIIVFIAWTFAAIDGLGILGIIGGCLG